MNCYFFDGIRCIVPVPFRYVMGFSIFLPCQVEFFTGSTDIRDRTFRTEDLCIFFEHIHQLLTFRTDSFHTEIFFYSLSECSKLQFCCAHTGTGYGSHRVALKTGCLVIPPIGGFGEFICVFGITGFVEISCMVGNLFNRNRCVIPVPLINSVHFRIFFPCQIKLFFGRHFNLLNSPGWTIGIINDCQYRRYHQDQHHQNYEHQWKTIN